ncbi:MAG TPA: hypothetical protein VKT78_10325 [Fimbriimonadaceae bacterium]|nr:hypothetical protein [Fimbriimonadaceae bacterium]
MVTDHDIDSIRPVCASLSTCVAGQVDYVLMVGLHLPGCRPAECDALLCLGDRGEGYPTRLFFAQEITPPKPYNLNWNARGVHILGRSWYAYSWKVPAGLSVQETLQQHLRPLQ